MKPSNLAIFIGFVTQCVRTQGTPADLHRALCRTLLGLDYPVWRSAMLMDTLDPEISGGRWVWSGDGSQEMQVTVNSHSRDLSDLYEHSPLRIVDETEQPLRVRLDLGPDATADERALATLPLLVELKEAGGTDYLILPLDFQERRRSAALSFTTQRQGGFTEEEIADLTLAASLISPVLEVRMLRLITENLIYTYVGPQAGASILDGQIRRGDGGRIRAAILLGDLRDFTHLTESLETEALLDVVNEFFEIVTAAAAERGGEVVQHIGDAILIYFEVRDGLSEETVCAQALAAAEEALARLAEANLERRRMGTSEIRCGIGLDLGTVTHGNIGSRRRLSFNVLGVPVNRAARIESLTKEEGTPLLMSAEFARRSGRPWVSLGPRRLKGVAEDVEIARPAAVNRAGPPAQGLRV